MSRVDRQGKLWPEQIQFMIITTILFTNTMFCKLTRSVCHQLKIDTRSRTGFYTLNLGQKIKNNSRHTSKALLIIFNFSSGWFCKENKNKNAKKNALSRLMLIFLTQKSEVSLSKRKNKRKINIDYRPTHSMIYFRIIKIRMSKS